MSFEIRYALGGGFGGCERMEWEKSLALTFDEAEKEAYQSACQEYESYAGLHGIRSINDIMEEEDCNEEEAEGYFNEECESWIEYEVREVNN